MPCFLSWIALFLITTSSSYPTQVQWYTNFDEAQALAQENDRPILLVFSGSDWCKPCIRLNRDVLEKEIFMEYARENWILVKLDFPLKRKNQLPPDQKAHNEKMAEKYNPKGIFPLVLLLDPAGEVISSQGYEAVSPEAYLQKLISAIN